MFKRECFSEVELGDDTISQLVSLTQQVIIIVERELQLAGFWESIPARKRLETELQVTLLSPEFSAVPDRFAKRSTLITKIMEIAEKNNDRILYAE
ncbi:hypothetical protein [Leptolyngbya sp. KIOST-1]|uniref:hypothetical protein n=1 Tax=Leptolyngbya sp. KIOST-1 TaxID=1229172 RepID=UPI0012E0AFC5|nr:hypothetical protein [Leptolyngbya sp. KIOST-1]